MASDWFVRISNVERGPISSEMLRHLALEGRVTPETPLRKGVAGTWVTANHVKGLFATADGDSGSAAALLAKTPTGKNEEVAPAKREAIVSAARLTPDVLSKMTAEEKALVLRALGVKDGMASSQHSAELATAGATMPSS
jgi:hypothetical protein